MLKLIIDDEADLPESSDVRALYSKQSDGTYLLGVEGAVSKKKLDEFRKSNVKLKKDLEKFGDLDPEEARDAIERKEEFELAGGEGGQAATAEKIREAAEKLAEQRVEKMKTLHDKQLGILKNERDKLQGSLADKVVGDALRKAGLEQGLRPEAVDDLIARGRQIFKVGESGDLVSLESDGETPRLNDKGDPFGPGDFVGGLVKTAPHLFGKTEGSGSTGSGQGQGSVGNDGVNPWAKDTFNLSEQGRILKADPDKARRLVAKVGKVIRS